MDFGELFLFVLGFLWVFVATIEDMKKREIANWINFSLVIFAIGFRFFYSLFFLDNFNFFYQGLIWFSVFFVLGNLFYYSKIFAGGDAKLMIALGPIISFSNSFSKNLNFSLSFLLLFLVTGALYGILVSMFLAIKNSRKFKKEFLKQVKLNKKLILFSVFFGILFLILGFISIFFIYASVIAFIFSFLYISAKSIDESCMVKLIDSRKLREGDWLYRGFKIKNKKILAKWEGLSIEEISFIKKNKKKVMIREGIPFTPVFLISFLTLAFLYFTGIIFHFFKVFFLEFLFHLF